MRRRAARLAVVLLASLVALPLGAARSARGADFPAADAGYHNYAELTAELQAVADAHPDIVARFSIGRSNQGREIWAAKVSDNVAVDEAEPEVLFDAVHHAREHIGLEQTLDLLHMLVDGYGVDTRVTALVNSHEIWIIFALNPDGAEYDLTGSPYRAWRKNRQPTPGSTHIGTDLNRNYAYRWGCCGGSSGDPASLTYRGPKPFSAPETRALRDFVNSRVVDGRQQIRAHITFHANGELVLWPYGHTYANIPLDMTADDHAAFVAMGRAMAKLNGYVAKQSSDLYITDGDEIDWLYGRHRIFSYTFELYPTEHYKTSDFYPPDEVLPAQTARNRSAILYLIGQSGCPYLSMGKAGANCGPFYDDLEISRGWTVDAHGTDTAARGAWQRGNPQPTSYNGPKQLDATTSGAAALVTGLVKGAYTSSNDVDGGVTSVLSPAIALPATPGRLTFRYYFAHTAGATAADDFRVVIEAPGGDVVVLVERAAATDDDAAWASASISLAAWAGQTIRVRFEAADRATDSLIEAAVDDVRVTRP